MLNSIKQEGEELSPVQEHPGAVDPNFLKAIEQLNEYQLSCTGNTPQVAAAFDDSPFEFVTKSPSSLTQ